MFSGPTLLGGNFGEVGRAWELESGHFCSSLCLVLFECMDLVTVSLSFSFLMCKIEIRILAAQSVCEDEMKKKSLCNVKVLYISRISSKSSFWKFRK